MMYVRLIKWAFFIVIQLFVSVQLAQAEALRMATVEQKPFVMKQNGELTGFSIDLFDAIALQLGRETRYIVAPGVPQMIEAVQNRDVDGAIANIAMTARLEKVVDFSQPVYDAGLRIMVPVLNGPSGLIPVGKAIWKAGLIQMLGIALLVLILASHVIWLLERGGHGFIRDAYAGGIWDAFWWSLVVLSKGGAGIESPSRAAAKIYGIFWVVVSLFVASVFIAKLTSAFTLQQLRGDIQVYQDLAGRHVGVVKGSAAERFLNRQNIEVVTYDSRDNLFKDVKRGQLEAAVDQKAAVEYYAQWDGRHRVRVVGPVFQTRKQGIALPVKSPLQEELNRTILRLHENGTYAALHKKWFGD